jgi:hypothetical protein
MTRRALSVLAFAICSSAATAQPKLDVPFGPTNFALVEAMLRVANPRTDDYLVDLGSGDGRINIIAARDLGVRGIGYELDPELVRQSRQWARLAGVEDKVRFVEEDLFGADLSRASIVAIYLGPVVTPRVRGKLLAELRPGTRIVSHNFEFGGWKPDLVVRPRDIGATIYFWLIPARVAGSWRGRLELAEGNRDYAIDLRQVFQELDGEARTDGLEVSLRDARLEGTRISFLLMERRGQAFSFRRFIGEVRGDEMTGHFRIESEDLRTEQPFRLTRSRAAEPGPPGAWTYRRERP